VIKIDPDNIKAALRSYVKQIKETDFKAWVMLAVIVLLLILAYSLGKYSSVIDATNACNEFWQQKVGDCILWAKK